MSCSSASTLKAQASVPLPNIPGLTPAGNQAFKIWAQSVLAQIQGAAGATGVNVIPQQYALIAGTLPPIASTSNCTVTADTGTPLFGAGGSYKIAITGSPATVTLAVDTAWPIHPGSAWIASFFQQASAAIAGVLTITTPTKSYTTDFTTTLSASGFQRLYDTLNLIADTATSFGVSFTFTGGTGQNVWLDGLMLEPYFGTAMQPSPFISTSPALLLDNNPDGSFSKILSTHTNGNVAYNFKGVWSSSTAYVVGDEVVYGQNYWLCTTANTNSAPPSADWQVVGSYAAFLGAWNSATTYAIGAEVTYNGNFWIAVAQNSNSAPSTSNANWQIAGPATLDNVADGPIYQRMPVANMDGNRRALIDWAQSGHINRLNLLNTSSWKVGTTGGQGNFVDNADLTYVLPSSITVPGASYLPIGPYGASEPVWVGYGAGTSCADGGWTNDGDLIAGFDATKSYLFTAWFCRVGAFNGQVYFGCHGSYTLNLDGTSNTNPYFVSPAMGATYPTQKWFLLVGIVHSSSYSGSQSGLSGVYDPTTGRLVLAGTDFKNAPGAPMQQHRCFGYYDTGGANLTSNDFIAFARPAVRIMDGENTSIQAILASSVDGLIDGRTYIRMPAPPAVSAAATTSLSQSGTTTTINVGASTFYLGNILLSASSGSVNPGAYGKYYVYFDASTYASGAQTYQATTDATVITQNPFRFYVGTITTASAGGGSGGGGGIGGGGCCLHESQMIELADGREVAARELTTGMTLVSHEGPTPVVQLRFLPHREWYRVRLGNGVELFVAGDHRFIDPDGNQLRAWDLKPKQMVRATEGYTFVTALEVSWEDAIKVAIEVGEPHTYYVQGILSHNKVLC